MTYEEIVSFAEARGFNSNQISKMYSEGYDRGHNAGEEEVNLHFYQTVLFVLDVIKSK